MGSKGGGRGSSEKIFHFTSVPFWRGKKKTPRWGEGDRELDQKGNKKDRWGRTTTSSRTVHFIKYSE